MVKLTLVYFGLKGRASAARLALRVGGVNFVDEHIPFEEWPNRKEDSSAFPMGQLPVLRVDDKVICQSHAIIFYCGTAAGLIPSDAWGKTKVLELVGCIDDTVSVLMPSLMEKDMEKKLRERAVLAKDTLPKIFSNFEKMVAANGHSGYAVGDKLSVVDLSFYQLISWMNSGTLDGIPSDFITKEKYPALIKVCDKVESLPNVKEWLAQEAAAH